MGWGLHVIIALSLIPSPNPVRILLTVYHTVLKAVCTGVGFESGSDESGFETDLGLRLIWVWDWSGSETDLCLRLIWVWDWSGSETDLCLRLKCILHLGLKLSIAQFAAQHGLQKLSETASLLGKPRASRQVHSCTSAWHTLNNWIKGSFLTKNKSTCTCMHVLNNSTTLQFTGAQQASSKDVAFSRIHGNTWLSQGLSWYSARPSHTCRE